MKYNSLLTINVVTFNHEKYLAKCLDSLLSQKTNFEFTIRIFDDCSSDNTDKICQEYVKKYPNKISYFPSKEKLGVALNSKRAYENINTKYYMFMEGNIYCCDDNKLQMQIDILEQNPQYVFCSHQTLGFNPQKPKKTFKFSFLKEGAVSYNDFYKKHVACVNSHVSSRVVRTECITIPKEDPEIFLFAPTQILMLLEQGDMYFIDKILTVYQQPENSTYSDASPVEKIENFNKRLLAYNKYSDGKLDMIIYKTMEHNINSTLGSIKKMKYPKSKLLKFRNYFMSPFLFYVSSFPRSLKQFIFYNLFAKNRKFKPIPAEKLPEGETLLTINVLTYNHGKYIAKCLDSLLCQKTNFRYIIRIFDDCSTDNTDKICKEYVQKYPERIIYLPNKKNMGDVLNAKRSYDNITTKYYMYIESDDYCCNDKKLQMQIDILEKNPQYVCCCHQSLGVNLNDVLLNEKVFRYTFLKEGILSKSDFYKKHVVGTNTHIPSRIVRTECINFVDHDPQIYMFDATQLLMLLEQGDIYFIDKVMTIYQQTGEGLYSGASASKRIEHYMNRLIAYSKYSDGELDMMLYKTLAQYIEYITRHVKSMEYPKSKITKIKNKLMSPALANIIYFPKKIKYELFERPKLQKLLR